MYRVGLIGDPVEHSRSPDFQNAALAHLGIAARYELWHTPAALLAERVADLRTDACLGANVTLPHKTAVMPLLDTLEPTARRIGAVNTIFKSPDGALVGANTDAPALLDDLRTAGNFDPAGQDVVLLGASGAARAAAFALLDAGVASLTVINRTLSRAENLLGDLLADCYGTGDDGLPPPEPAHVPRLFALTYDDADTAAAVAACHLLINATSLGWQPDATPLPDPPLAAGTLVYDMVYQPTRLLHEAQERGALPLDGLGMLVRQGALAFERWTGQPAPLAVMRTALRPTL